jgi:hypothetical protein
MGAVLALEARKIRVSDGAATLNWTIAGSADCMLASKGTKVVLRGIRLRVRGAGIPFSGMEMSVIVRSRQQSCGAVRRRV